MQDGKTTRCLFILGNISGKAQSGYSKVVLKMTEWIWNRPRACPK